MMSSTLRRAALAGALLAAGFGQSAAAQTFEWAQPRAYTYASDPTLVHSAAAVRPGGGGWWATPEDHQLFYGLDDLSAVRFTRLRADGTIAQQRLAQGNASVLQLQATADGAAFVLGQYLDSLVFDRQHRYLKPAGQVNLVYFVARLDSAGNVSWLHQLRPAASASQPWVDHATALNLDPRGGSAWVGYGAFGDSYATRFDLATGDSLASVVQRRVGRISSLAPAPDGTLYVAGSCADDSAFFNGTRRDLPAGITYNTYVACYNPTGTNRWVQHVEDVTCPNAWVATADTSGVYFAGPLFGQWRFGAFQASLNAPNTNAYFLTRLNRATGSFQWLRESPVPTLGAMVLGPVCPLTADAAGNAWLLVTSQGSTTWPGFGTLTAPQGGGTTVVAYDRAGTVRAVQMADGESSVGLALSLDPTTDKVLLAGVAQTGNVQLAPLLPLPAVPSSQEQLFAASFRITLSPLGTRPDAANPAPFNLYPNPAATGEPVQLDAPTGTRTEIFDALGRRVLSVWPAGSSDLIAPAQPGLYLIRYSDAQGKSLGSARLVVRGGQ